MPGTPYSTRFLGLRAAGSSQPSYTIPAGYVGVVRSISLYNGATGSADMTVFINGAWNLFSWPGVATHQSVSLDCRQVLRAGETIAAASTGSSFDCTISGYLLIAGP